MGLDTRINRSEVVTVEGTRVTFRCLIAQHVYRKDYGKGRASKRVSTEGVEMLTQYWIKTGGVYGVCPICHKLSRRGAP